VIVDRHGGRARAERSDSGGLRVRLELPRLPAPTPAAAESRSPASQAAPGASGA
jgi:hypothetical protein